MLQYLNSEQSIKATKEEIAADFREWGVSGSLRWEDGHWRRTSTLP